jgi:phage gpG-like protein
MIDASSAMRQHVLAAFYATQRPMYAGEVAIRLGIPSGNLMHTIKRLLVTGMLEYIDYTPPEMRPLTGARGFTPRRWTGRRRYMQLTDEGREQLDDEVRRLSWRYEARSPE